MLQEVFVFLKIRFRNWLREKLQADIKAGARDRAFLDNMPWLKQLLPLGTYLANDDRNHIKVQRVDAEILFDPFTFKDVYFVSEDGVILAKTRGEITTGWFGAIRKAEPPHITFARLGKCSESIKYLVVVESVSGLLYLPIPGWGEVTIYKFPKDESPIPFVQRLLAEHRAAVANREETTTQLEQQRYKEGIAAAEELKS